MENKNTIMNSLIEELPKGLINWLDLPKQGRGLVLAQEGSVRHSIAEYLSHRALDVMECDLESFFELDTQNKFDCIILMDVLEASKVAEQQKELMRLIKNKLNEEGRLFVIADNRFAIRYFCGDEDPFTSRNFDGIEDYRRISCIDERDLKGKLFSKAELVELFEESGFEYYKFYSVFPELSAPQIILSDGYKPNEDMGIRIFPQYNRPGTVFLEEEFLYTSLLENDMLHAMANGFVIELARSEIEQEKFSEAKQVTVSMDRGKKDAFLTIIYDDYVEKKPVYKEGKEKLDQIAENSNYLHEHGVPMIIGEQIDDAYVMPFVYGESLVQVLREMMKTDIDGFLALLDAVWELIKTSSEHVSYDKIDWAQFDPRIVDAKEKGKGALDLERWRRVVDDNTNQEVFGPILKRGYLDLVLVNGMMTEEGMMFFDQEEYAENVPARSIMLRNIYLIYRGNTELYNYLPLEELYERYELARYIELYDSFGRTYLTNLRNDDLLREYHRQRRYSLEVLNSNRQRMNFSTDEYIRLFVNIFRNLNNKELYLFGSGNFTKKFLALYKDDYEIDAIFDNNKQMHGQTLEGIEICSPEVLENKDPSTYKVIICIKNYTGVLKQIKRIGATNIGIYDANMEYPRKDNQKIVTTKKCDEKKKYHVGYVAGVFDMFHIGHLNLLRKAKEQCDYLIVGVVSDEGVRRGKKTEPMICGKDRLAIVESCRYVDEAIEIPLNYCDTKDAYLRFQFDAQFSGSDYADDTVWLEKQSWLRERGADLVFFPYTEGTSSTKLKEAIGRKT